VLMPITSASQRALGNVVVPARREAMGAASDADTVSGLVGCRAASFGGISAGRESALGAQLVASLTGPSN
jgi:hypothetical protein